MFIVALACAAIWAAAPAVLDTVTQRTQAQAGTVPSLTATLMSPSGPIIAWGNAFYGPTNAADRVLRVDAANLNPNTTTPHVVFLNNVEIGHMTRLSPAGNQWRLFLTTANGGTVPFVVSGDNISIRNGNMVELAGVFGPPSSPTPPHSPTPHLTPTPHNSPTPPGSPVPLVQLWAELTGEPIDGITPRGMARYFSGGPVGGTNTSFRTLNVWVSYVNLPEGTQMQVVVDGNPVGGFVLHNRAGHWSCGNTVTPVMCPVVTNGSTIAVRTGDVTRLAGTFSNVPPSPNPTPSVSPTPTGTPHPPRTFRAHLTGDSVVPPVTTPALGKGFVNLMPATSANTMRIGVWLTQRDLSSAVTARTINGPAAAGENAPVIFTLANNPTPIPGTNGFLQIFNITPAQLAELRAGLWYFNVATADHPDGEIRGQILSGNHRSDFNGDGASDIGVMRTLTDAPDNASNVWYVLHSGDNTVSSISIGRPGDINVQGDYDGDATADVAMFTPSTGIWQIRRSETATVTEIKWGQAGDIPVVGDHDGDGLNDPAVFRPSNGVWYVMRSVDGGFSVRQWGMNGDRPVSGDFDGDGSADMAVFRPSTGTWYINRSSNGSLFAMQWGMDGDRPVSGDFDGDGTTDIAVYRPSTGIWYINRSSGTGLLARQFGAPGDIPVACEFTGDGITDIAVYRPSNGHWYMQSTANGAFTALQFGLATDSPLNSVYAP
jgi:hypothetical protein